MVRCSLSSSDVQARWNIANKVVQRKINDGQVGQVAYLIWNISLKIIIFQENNLQLGEAANPLWNIIAPLWNIIAHAVIRNIKHPQKSTITKALWERTT